MKRLFIFLAITIVFVIVFVVLRSRAHAPSPHDTNVFSTATIKSDSPLVDVYPEVWVKNGYDGASFEYKTNCGPDYETLEECFLRDLTRVAVTAPDGTVTELEKDFNIQEYSGEITRRWVVYGLADAGFPKAGTYIFNYYQGEEITLAQTVIFNGTIVDFPTNVTHKRIGSDLIVTWTPPDGITEGMWYKVIVFPENNGGIISQQIEWSAHEAVLKKIPLADGTEIGINVAVYWDTGYAYPKNIDVDW